MREPYELCFKDEVKLKIDGYPNLLLESSGDDRGLPADLSIKTPNGEFLFEYFIDRRFDQELSCISSLIYYDSNGLDYPYLFIIGIYDVLYIDPKTFNVKHVLKLNRSDREDTGFYQLHIHEYKDSVIIRYESGVCKFSKCGTLLWHTPKLYWDDIFLRHELNYYIYSNEHRNDNAEWRIDLNNGNILSP